LLSDRNRLLGFLFARNARNMDTMLMDARYHGRGTEVVSRI
jgi:hypothetical protein